ncbi:MAG TPA: acyltransferase [Thermoanaerobaculia bacterium]|nr:acyltransferase [Thermoanaerobaculia bacterium]
MQERSDWPDRVKGIGMFTVFHGHLSGAFGLVGSAFGELTMKFWATFMVAAFLMISGYFFKDRGLRFGPYLARIARARLLPVVGFELVGLVLVLGMLAVSGRLSAETALKVSRQVLLLAAGWPLLNPVSWFLVTLFTLEVAQYFVARLTRPTWAVAVAAVLFGLATWAFPFDVYIAQQPYHPRGWWFTTPAMAGMVFYQAGVLLRRWRVPERLGRLPKLGLTLACTLAVFLTFDLNQGPFPQLHAHFMPLPGMSAFGNLPWFFTTGLVGGLAVFGLCQLLPHSKLLEAIGRNTTTLLCLNSFCVLLVNPAVVSYFGKTLGWISPWAVALQALLGTLICLAIAVPLADWIAQKAPWLAGRSRPPAALPANALPLAGTT